MKTSCKEMSFLSKDNHYSFSCKNQSLKNLNTLVIYHLSHYNAINLSILYHLHDVTTSQGESTSFYKKQLTPCVLDAELDCFEDFKPIKMDHS